MFPDVAQAAGDAQFAAMAEVNLAECALAHGDLDRAAAFALRLRERVTRSKSAS